VARSQDLVFTLYGDYLRHRGGEAWTGSLEGFAYRGPSEGGIQRLA